MQTAKADDSCSPEIGKGEASKSGDDIIEADDVTTEVTAACVTSSESSGSEDSEPDSESSSDEEVGALT